MTYRRDDKAVKILTKAYWGAKGWKIESALDSATLESLRGQGLSLPPPTSGFSESDVEYLKSAGMYFEPSVRDHDLTLTRLRQVVSKLDPRRIGGAFLASLSTRWLELRSALGSYAFARQLPEHSLSPDLPGTPSPRCSICFHYGISSTNPNILNFERFKWGGVGMLDPEYCLFDLDQFSRIQAPEPSQEDRRIMSGILETASGLESNARASTLEKGIAKLLPSSKQERRVLIDILAVAGILEPGGAPSYFRTHVKPWDRERLIVEFIGDGRSDWGYPAFAWRGSDGVQEDAVRFYFGPGLI